MVEKELVDLGLTQEMEKVDSSTKMKNSRGTLKLKTPTKKKEEDDVNTSSTPHKKEKGNKNINLNSISFC